jgi:hypothetical protein
MCFNQVLRNGGICESGGTAPRILNIETRKVEGKWLVSRPDGFIPG